MHDTALAFGKLFFDTYLPEHSSLTVIDVGATDVNGSLRSVAPRHCNYIGVDMAPGKGVDVVISDPYVLPFETGTADAVLSSSCFEHTEHFWLLFNEIQRVLKPDGIFYLNVPSNGLVHRFPVDCWRFYPDSGEALASWGRKCGYSTAVLESFVASRVGDIWNDFVAVFLKDASHSPRHPRRMSDGHPSLYNVIRTHQNSSRTLSNVSALSEDMLIQQHYASEIKRLTEQLAVAQHTIQTLNTTLSERNGRDMKSAGAQG